MQELKLKVGKKYILPDNFYNLNTKIAICLAIHDGNYVMMSEESHKLFWILCTDNKLNLIKEHREPFKNVIEGWIGYNKGEHPDPYLASTLMNNYAGDRLYKSRNDMDRYWSEKIRVRITLEELPEQE